jgi:Spy/CpxP family protein refolding chaperone
VKTTFTLLMFVSLLFSVTAGRTQTPPLNNPENVPAKIDPNEAELLLLASADDPVPTDPAAQRGPGRNSRRGPADVEQRRKFLDQLRVLKLLEVLNLREDQEPKFLQAFSDMRRRQRQVEEERAAVIDELAQNLQERKVDSKRIDEIIAKLTLLGTERAKLVTDFVASMRQLLTPEQLGRFIVFQDRFEYELLQRVRGFRARMQGGNEAEDSAGNTADDR